MKRLNYHHKETEWRTLKTETNRINQTLPYISTNNITELNELIYAGVKLECEKIGIPSKSTKKPGGKFDWKRRLKKSTKTGLNRKTKISWNMWEQNGKDNTRKNNNTT